MAKHILKCMTCQKYTMDQHCSCGGKAVSPKPAKYSPEDKYGHMRREVKKKELIEKGLLEV